MMAIITVFSACGTKPSNSDDETNSGVILTEDNTMPIVKDGSVTLTVAAYDNYYTAASYKNNLPVWKAIEEKTGVKINWDVIPSGQYAQTMTIRLASAEDHPDLFTIPSSDPVKYGTDGIVVPMNDLIDKYAPNTKKFLEDNPAIRSLLTAPDGNIYRLASVTKGENLSEPSSWLIRKDWLDKLNLKEPTTIDEWYDVLKAFKEKDPNGNGKADELPMVFAHYTGLNTFGNAWGLHLSSSEGFWPNEDGQMEYEWQDERAKELVKFLRKLHKEGLIEPDYLSTNTDGLKTKTTKNLVGATFAYMNYMDTADKMLKSAGVDDSNWIAVVPPQGPNGYKGHIEKSPPLAGFFAISSTSKYKEIAMKWLDYVYASEEGNLFTTFGIEGLSYEMVDGEPVLTDWALNNPDGLDITSALRSIGAAPTLPYIRSEEGIYSRFPKASIVNNTKRQEGVKKVTPYLVDCFPRSLILATAEESMTMQPLMADLDSTVQEWVAKFITGSADIDDKWDDFQKDLKKVGIDKILKIEQQQYERYKN